MPTYSYTCDACGKSFEKEQRIIEDALKDCVLCGKPKARRLITSGNFILKGGGWYSDGYGSAKSSSSSTSSTGSSTSGSASTPSTPTTSTPSTPSTGTDGGSKPSAKVEAAE